MVNNMNMNARRNSQPSNSGASCNELMCAIMEADFFAQDLKLYLDTHPNDERALEMYREACKQYKACKAAFEECCYPLTPCGADCDCEWEWLCGVWPPNSL